MQLAKLAFDGKAKKSPAGKAQLQYCRVPPKSSVSAAHKTPKSCTGFLLRSDMPGCPPGSAELLYSSYGAAEQHAAKKAKVSRTRRKQH